MLASRCARFKLSTLFPGQPVVAPAVVGAAVVILVEVALETLVNVEYPGEIRLQQQLSRLQRPLAAAADQNDRRAAVIHGADGTAQQQFTDIWKPRKPGGIAKMGAFSVLSARIRLVSGL